jgi:hypothetical protein
MLKMMRSLDVRAALTYMRQTTGKPFVPAPSKVKGRFYTGDEKRACRPPQDAHADGLAGRAGGEESLARAQASKNRFRRPWVYAFIVGFNEWVLKSFVSDMKWRRSKSSKDASGWEHDGQVIREKTLQALTSMHGRNCRLIGVKPAKRGGYMPSQLMTNRDQRGQAPRHPGRRIRANLGLKPPTRRSELNDGARRPRLAHIDNLPGEAGVHGRAKERSTSYAGRRYPRASEYKQAIVERSHYYTGPLHQRRLNEITRLRKLLGQP